MLRDSKHPANIGMFIKGIVAFVFVVSGLQPTEPSIIYSEIVNATAELSEKLGELQKLKSRVSDTKAIESAKLDEMGPEVYTTALDFRNEIVYESTKLTKKIMKKVETIQRLITYEADVMLFDIKETLVDFGVDVKNEL